MNWQQDSAEHFDRLKDIRFDERLQLFIWNTETGTCMFAHIKSTRIK